MLPERLLPLSEVETIVGLKKSKLYALIQEGTFPSPVKLGSRAVRWKASAVYSWIDKLPTTGNIEEAAA